MHDEMINAIVTELNLRKKELANQTISTIYFGGGTPSVVTEAGLGKILQTIRSNFSINEDIECTLEANPDDCSMEALLMWKSLGINRLSIGVQSFDQHDLEWMNRSHNSKQAIQAITSAAEAGFKNVNLDLIYGVPSMSNATWQSNVQQALALPINHISAYSLTVEKGTALHHFIKNNTYPAMDDEKAVREFEYFQEQIKLNHWEQYEISNYCKDQQYAVHNTNYWRQKDYLGVGPSAHSYNGKIRRWNIANNQIYMEKIRRGESYFEEEKLSQKDCLNERIMLGLRTKWGVDLNELKAEFNYEILTKTGGEIDGFLKRGLIQLNGQNLMLTDQGKSFADQIASELFI